MLCVGMKESYLFVIFVVIVLNSACRELVGEYPSSDGEVGVRIVRKHSYNPFWGKISDIDIYLGYKRDNESTPSYYSLQVGNYFKEEYKNHFEDFYPDIRWESRRVFVIGGNENESDIWQKVVIHNRSDKEVNHVEMRSRDVYWIFDIPVNAKLEVPVRWDEVSHGYCVGYLSALVSNGEVFRVEDIEEGKSPCKKADIYIYADKIEYKFETKD